MHLHHGKEASWSTLILKKLKPKNTSLYQPPAVIPTAEGRHLSNIHPNFPPHQPSCNELGITAAFEVQGSDTIPPVTHSESPTAADVFPQQPTTNEQELEGEKNKKEISTKQMKSRLCCKWFCFCSSTRTR